jgi:hypothetical protein
VIEVGQKLWFVPAQRYAGAPREIAVTKVGRKWAYTDEGRADRFDVNTLALDGHGYNSPGRLYLRREDHALEVEVSAEWSKAAASMRNKYRAPEGVSVADIKAAVKLLKL